MELTDEAQKLGKVEPSRAGTVAGVLHRAWFELKADIGTGDAGILRSVNRGESRARSAYEHAISLSLPENIESVVRRQYESVKTAHARVQNWNLKSMARSA